MPPPVDPKIVKHEQDELKKVTLKRFGVVPRKVQPFGKVDASWETVVPASDVDITIQLNDSAVAPVGAKSFTLTQPRTFTLNAVSENAGRRLRSIGVTIDDAACVTKVLADAFVITSILKNEIDKSFTGNDQFTLRGDGTGVSMNDNGILIGVPLTIKVENFFDAKMDIGIDLAINGTAVQTKALTVNVSWSFFEHLTTLGCTGVVQSGMEKMAKAFLEKIVDTQVSPLIADRFKAEVQKFVDGLTASKGRPFGLTAVIFNKQGLRATACPK